MDDIRIAGIEPESFVDGPGVRYTIFMQGCTRGCKGCHNPQTHDPTGGERVPIKRLIDEIMSDPLVSGVTISGGEPMMQPFSLHAFLVDLKERCKEENRQLNIWMYTGYKVEELKTYPGFKSIYPYLDMIVDGEYKEELRDLTLEFRGSSNQRLVDRSMIEQIMKEGENDDLS